MDRNFSEFLRITRVTILYDEFLILSKELSKVLMRLRYLRYIINFTIIVTRKHHLKLKAILKFQLKIKFTNIHPHVIFESGSVTLPCYKKPIYFAWKHVSLKVDRNAAGKPT